MTHPEPAERFVGVVEEPPVVAAVAASRLKRTMDVLIAAVALLVLLPFLLLIWAAIYVESGGPVLFRQKRCGLEGRTFEILKFRTMHVAQPALTVVQAVPGDPRVTRVGRILRKFSFDELPQLLNVLSGEMSLVGPRPHAVSHDLIWSRTAPGYAGRYRARPGLTGLAQVRGHRGMVATEDAIARRVAADNAYIDGWSVLGDVKLILLTIPLLFGDEAAF